mgnify:CR=1 FL=1
MIWMEEILDFVIVRTSENRERIILNDGVTDKLESLRMRCFKN